MTDGEGHRTLQCIPCDECPDEGAIVRVVLPFHRLNSLSLSKLVNKTSFMLNIPSNKENFKKLIRFSIIRSYLIMAGPLEQEKWLLHNLEIKFMVLWKRKPLE
jgi:hypothetical protein